MGYRKLLYVTLLAFLFSCQPDNDDLDFRVEDFRYEHSNEEFFIKVDSSRSVRAYLSKPEGGSMDIVIVLHSGTFDFSNSHNSTLRYGQRDDAGQIFLDEGKAVLSLEYTEFEANGSISPRGIKELQDVVSTIDWLKTNPFLKNKFNIERVFTFGTNRGGGLALLAGIERQIDGAISAEGQLDWIATLAAIQNGSLNPNVEELANFDQTVAAWDVPGSEPDLWTFYSPAQRFSEFQSPFLIISGQNNPIALFQNATAMQSNFNKCTECMTEGNFILHPNGLNDWAKEDIVNQIKSFVK